VDIVVSFIAIAVLVALLIFVRRRAAAENARPAPRPMTKSSSSSSRFHAVSIRYDSSACAAARSMEGRRFLSGAAPKLPLPECDVAVCKCRFRHHSDRRTGKDRRNIWGQGFGAAATGSFPQEKREGGDRRKSDSDGLI
jgi:hypothetical protein